MSDGTDPKQRKTYRFHKKWEEEYFLSCSNPDVCASSAMPESRFLRRATLKGISQPYTKGTRRIFLSK